MKKLNIITASLTLVLILLFACKKNKELTIIQEEILIGNQTWTKKNLDVATYRNGDAIPQVQDTSAWANLTTGAWCYYANNNANGTTYGKLYNWYAVNDPRGLAPNGYHIPTGPEWSQLIDYLGGETIAGNKMMEAGISHWLSPNTEATNSSGFTGLPGGFLNNGIFYGISDRAAWWSSSVSNSSTVFCRFLRSYGIGNFSLFSKRQALSVRCLRDGDQPPPCSFKYSAWSVCSSNIQKRTYSTNGCSLGTPPADSIERICANLPDTYLNKNFDDNSITSGGWTSQNVIGSISWAASAFGGKSFAKITNYVSTTSVNIACESWLISPPISLSTSTNPILSFQNAYKYTGSALEVYVSTNYNSGLPSSATWVPLTFTLSAGNFVFISSGNISLSNYKNSNTRIAFKYLGSANDGSTWELDDVLVKEN